MADREDVAKRDGVYRTNWVTVERDLLADGYELVRFDMTELTATGYHKVLGVFPLDKQAPRFLGRWDKKTLDFDLVDSEDTVLPDKPLGHHTNPHPQGGQRFVVELGPNPNDPEQVIFRGTVAVSLGFRIIPATGSYTISGSPPELSHAQPIPGATDPMV